MKTLPSRLKKRNNNNWLYSIVLHLLLLIPFAIIYFFPAKKITVNKTEIKILEARLSEKPEVKLQPINPQPKAKPKPPPTQKAFGLNNKTLKSESSESAGVSIKDGNTIAKEIDQIPVKPEDALPVPTDEFLVAKMPRIKNEIKAPYPDEARKNNIEGVVVMDILIDEKGLVRQVELIEGPGYGLNESAIRAVSSFVFSPAELEAGQKVAVRIRYRYRFILSDF